LAGELTALAKRVRGRATRETRRIRYSGWLSPRLSLSRVPAPADDGCGRRYYLPIGYAERLEPEYCEDDYGAEYQPDVYRQVADLAQTLGATTIVDVGCGRAFKLAALHSDFNVVGIDFGSNIEYCRGTYRFGTWIDHDLERQSELPVDRTLLADSVVVCADVIEHLQRPERALRAIREAATLARATLISTPDRNRTEDRSPAGPPLNPCHVREWTRGEFASLLRWCGFDRGYLTYTRAYQGAPGLTTILYVLRGSLAKALTVE
jgi:hypothetical protein